MKTETTFMETYKYWRKIGLGTLVKKDAEKLKLSVERWNKQIIGRAEGYQYNLKIQVIFTDAINI
jgi:hypothetical protein